MREWDRTDLTEVGRKEGLAKGTLRMAEVVDSFGPGSFVVAGENSQENPAKQAGSFLAFLEVFATKTEGRRMKCSAGRNWLQPRSAQAMPHHSDSTTCTTSCPRDVSMTWMWKIDF